MENDWRTENRTNDTHTIRSPSPSPSPNPCWSVACHGIFELRGPKRPPVRNKAAASPNASPITYHRTNELQAKQAISPQSPTQIQKNTHAHRTSHTPTHTQHNHPRGGTEYRLSSLPYAGLPYGGGGGGDRGGGILPGGSRRS